MRTMTHVMLLSLLAIGVANRMMAIGTMDTSPPMDLMVGEISNDQTLIAITVHGDQVEFVGTDSEITSNPVVKTETIANGMTISVWDSNAAVYVTAGADGEPGAANVDDDGNGVVDDRSELGATGSDDAVLTPGDVGYETAVAEVNKPLSPGYRGEGTGASDGIAVVLGRGAMRKVVGDAVIRGPGQVRIDWIDQANRMTSLMVDLVTPP